MKNKVSVLLAIFGAAFLGIAMVAQYYSYASEIYLFCAPICFICAIVLRIFKKEVLLYVIAVIMCYVSLISFIVTGWLFFAALCLMVVILMAVVLYKRKR